MSKASEIRGRGIRLGRKAPSTTTPANNNAENVRFGGILPAVITQVDEVNNLIKWRALRYQNDDPQSKMLEVFGPTLDATPFPTALIEQYKWLEWNSDPDTKLIPVKMFRYRGNWHPEFFFKADVSPYTQFDIPVLADF